MTFTQFLLILQYCFDKMLTFTSNVITLLITNNFVKFCVCLAVAYFIISIFLDVQDFVPKFLLRRRLENRDVEFQGVTDTTSMSYRDESGAVNRRVITKGRRQSRRVHK